MAPTLRRQASVSGNSVASFTFLPRICSRNTDGLGCFVPPCQGLRVRSKQPTIQWEMEAKQPISDLSRCGGPPACSLFLLTCALLMTSSRSEGHGIIVDETQSIRVVAVYLDYTARGRKSSLATKNLLEDTDGLRRPPLEGGGDAIHQCPLDAVALCFLLTCALPMTSSHSEGIAAC